MQQEQIKTSLPENAYRELKAGEEYEPVMGAATQPKEVTPYSVTLGIIMAVLFSAAAAYLGLKVGQVFEAAIPIAIIAVGLGQMRGKKNMLGQHHPVDWCFVGRYRCGCYLHTPRTLHPRSRGALLSGIPLITSWWCVGYRFVDSLPQVLR